jgi:peptide deformylase
VSAYDECVQWPANVLRERANLVVDYRADSFREIVAKLVRVAARDHRSLGVAAPQLGFCIALFVARLGLPDRGLVVVCNPVLSDYSLEVDEVEEGCFSFPEGRLVPIVRSIAVTLEYTDLRGRSQTRRLHGLPARVAQHEADHLAGITIQTYKDAEEDDG